MLLGLLRRHLAPYKRSIWLLILLQFVQTAATLYLPTLNADIIDHGVVVGDTGYIVRTGAIMLGVSLIQIVCSGGAVYYGARTAMILGRDVRAAVFTKVQTLSAREVAGFGAPSLITRTTNDVLQVQTLALMTFTLVVAAPITLVGGVILALRQDAPLSLLLVVVAPLLVAVITAIIRRMRPLFRTMQTRIDGVNRILREQISGIRVIRAFVRDTHERQRFASANEQVRDVAIDVGRLMALMFPTVMLIVNVSSVAVIWLGGYRIDAGGMQLGALTAFLSYLMQILMAVMMAAFMFVMYPRAEVCADRIQEVLDTESSVPLAATPDLITVLPERGELELRGAEFRYPGAESPVLSGVDLVAHPGQTTAIIGSTAAARPRSCTSSRGSWTPQRARYSSTASTSVAWISHCSRAR